MARKSHPGGAETYWESELSKARDAAAGMVGLCARVGSLRGLSGPDWVTELEKWCDEQSKAKRESRQDEQDARD